MDWRALRNTTGSSLPPDGKRAVQSMRGRWTLPADSVPEPAAECVRQARDPADLDQ